MMRRTGRAVLAQVGAANSTQYRIAGLLPLRVDTIVEAWVTGKRRSTSVIERDPLSRVWPSAQRLAILTFGPTSNRH
jgi:hypothetical protein